MSTSRHLKLVVRLVPVLAMVFGWTIPGHAKTPPGRYCIIDDESVLDSATGLTWARKVTAGNFHWQEAVDQCSNQMVNGMPGRLPSLKELLTLGDEKLPEPSVDTTVFPATPAESFWTSTVPGTDSSKAGIVLGINVLFDKKTVNHKVRCVR